MGISPRERTLEFVLESIKEMLEAQNIALACALPPYYPASTIRMMQRHFPKNTRTTRGSRFFHGSGLGGYLPLVLSVSLFLGGCASVSLSGKPKEGPGGNQGQVQGQQPTGSTSGNAPNIAGYWKINYTVSNKPMTASARITQAGNSFQGSGSDDHNSSPFNITEGKVTGGGEVRFYKKYSTGKAAPIEYTGKMRMVDAMGYKGPYMEGEYVTAFNGKIIEGKWEAQTSAIADPSPPPAQPPVQMPNQEPAQQPMPPDQGPPAGGGPPPDQGPPPQQGDPSKAPHLSGKWNTGFLYHGKTIHSTMYIEQEAGNVRGHGFDEETKEKFTLKGWYSFPKLQFVRKYEKAKGAKTSKELTFRANVSILNEGSYSGPYLEGETTLGERWEAQALR